MADFKEAYKIVKAIEGGYANDPQDTGGETYKGISRKNFPSWAGWAIIDAYKTKFPQDFEMKLEEDTALEVLVLSFFKKEFWDLLQLDFVKEQKIAAELFDTGVNMGTGRAAMFLQITLNALNRNGKDYPDLKEDHSIGPKTVEVLNAHKSPGNVLKVLNCLQGSKYVDITRANPSQEKFMASWLSRVGV